jgi:hypothetical protein
MHWSWRTGAVVFMYEHAELFWSSFRDRCLLESPGLEGSDADITRTKYSVPATCRTNLSWRFWFGEQAGFKIYRQGYWLDEHSFLLCFSASSLLLASSPRCFW